jgi:hypothetical protein
MANTMTDEQTEGMKALVANQTAMLELLVNKGIFTEKEYEDASARWMAKVDQMQAKRREDFLKTPEGQAAAFLGKLMGIEV